MSTVEQKIVFIGEVLGISEPYPGFDLNGFIQELKSVSNNNGKRIDMAAADCVELISHWQVDRLEDLDGRTMSAGGASIFEIIKDLKGKVDKIVQRGNISNDFDYYVAKSIVGSDVVGGDLLKRLKESVERYEGV